MKLVKAVRANAPTPRLAPINNAAAQQAIWLFYNSNPDRVILKVGGFIKIRVRDLRILFEMIAGPEPEQ